MEVFVLGRWPREEETTWAFLVVAKSEILAAYSSLRQAGQLLDALVEPCSYRAAGEDQVRISTDSLEVMARVLRNSVVRRAARTLILRLMRKGATLYAKFHCPQLAREVA